MYNCTSCNEGFILAVDETYSRHDIFPLPIDLKYIPFCDLCSYCRQTVCLYCLGVRKDNEYLCTKCTDVILLDTHQLVQLTLPLDLIYSTCSYLRPILNVEKLCTFAFGYYELGSPIPAGYIKRFFSL